MRPTNVVRLMLWAGALAVLAVAALGGCGGPHAVARPGPSVAGCTTATLQARFVGGGLGTGNDFGAVVVWNTGPRPCRLAGPVGFSALLASGAVDPVATANRPVQLATVVLPARMPAPTAGQGEDRYLVADLMGPERDDPAQSDGLCRAADKVTPKTLLLSIGPVRLSVRNLDRWSHPDVPSIYGCHGRVLLEDVRGPVG